MLFFLVENDIGMISISSTL